MQTVVLTSPSADARSRRALSRALERWPSSVEDAPLGQRAERLQALATQADVEWIVVVDADAVLAPDAFGSLRRVLTPGLALAGGRAVVGVSQRLGAMFGPPRSGPNPFDLVTLAGAHEDRVLADLARGPIDVPQRGAFVVAADFVRDLGSVALDPVLLHIDLAAYARAAGRPVICEPSLAFESGEDSRELRSRLVNLRRYAGVASWRPDELHREPARLRASFIQREVRIMGNYRGFMRRPFPAIDILAVTSNELDAARVQRSVGALAPGGRVTVCAPGDGDVLRAALTHTSDRYLLVADGADLPGRAQLEALVERIEQNACTALATESLRPPFGAVLLHCGRIINGGKLRGATVREVVADAVERLPQRQLVVTALKRDAAPRAVPPPPEPQSLDVIFVAASKPTVTQQTLGAVLAEPINGARLAVYPAGSATTGRLLSVHTSVRLVPDASDVQLAVGLNRALGASRSDTVAIVRDDVQLPHGALKRLQSAFARIPRLGAAVPRVGGSNRPEALPEQGYLNLTEMQYSFDRRAEAYAREAMLVDVATTPVIVISREALEVVGGFDETFGFSRLGVEDFTRRLRNANFLVAVCEDSYAHLFAFEEAASFVGNLDDSPFLRAAYEQRWANRHDFDPARDRVPLRADEPAQLAPGRGLRILLPLGSDAEWSHARGLLNELALAFRAHDPLEVSIGLDGSFGLQEALVAIRELLIATNIPMEQTLNVSLDFVPDMTMWSAAGERRTVRVAGIDRDALAEVPSIDGVRAVRALFAELDA
ncbi:MAG TPA: hypothetical protein VGP41_10485 [Candidatus Lustribacter sp.]|nr:hypothetical protein [Candidatus Lustribacter sp.]